MKLKQTFDLLTSVPVSEMLQAVGAGNSNVKKIQIATRKKREAVSVLLAYLMANNLIDGKKLDPDDARKITYTVNYLELKKLYFQWAGKDRQIPDQTKDEIAANPFLSYWYDLSFRAIFANRNKEKIGGIQEIFYLHALFIQHQIVLWNFVNKSVNPLQFTQKEIDNAKSLHDFLIAHIVRHFLPPT